MVWAATIVRRFMIEGRRVDREIGEGVMDSIVLRSSRTATQRRWFSSLKISGVSGRLFHFSDFKNAIKSASSCWVNTRSSPAGMSETGLGVISAISLRGTRRSSAGPRAS